MDHTPSAIVPDILVAENIFLSIGAKDILRGVNVSAEKGHITGILGRNGAGKSTMLQSVFGVRKAQECDTFLNGIKIRRAYTMDGLLNYLPQAPFLPRHLSLRTIAWQFGVRPDEFISWFPDLAGDMAKPVSDVSGGRERLFSVALLLLTNSRFTFLDEPFSHIMPLHVDRLKALLLQQKAKKGIIITDHMYRHLLEVSDRIYLVKEGKTIFIRDKADLALHGYLRAYEEQ